jgi:hypothetical protein
MMAIFVDTDALLDNGGDSVRPVPVNIARQAKARQAKGKVSQGKARKG